jgi:hypothetical protein
VSTVSLCGKFLTVVYKELGLNNKLEGCDIVDTDECELDISEVREKKLNQILNG